MKKNFVFDTNVLLTDPYAILKFGDNNIIIPITVIEELDKFKRELSTVGRCAREAARLIDEYRNKGNLSKGVPLENGGTLRIVTDLGKEPPLPFPTLGKTADSLILATALKVKKREENIPVIFVTRDINLRLRADAVGLTAENYEEHDTADIEEIYSGKNEVNVPIAAIEEFLATGKYTPPEGHDMYPNQCVTLVDPLHPKHAALGRYHREENCIRPLRADKEDVWGIYPRNREQRFALDLLLDDSIQLVTLAGKAGTGKTLMAIAAGLRKVCDEGIFSKIVVARPIMQLGKELGFLPGELSEKLRPWMEPVFDNLELIMNASVKKNADGSFTDRMDRGSRKPGSGSGRKANAESIRQLMDLGILEVQALTYIRGRSLPGQYLVIDEAQNLTAHEVKTIITRAGEGTKVVLTGDPYQIDNPFLDLTTSGLTIVIERFKNEKTCGHITLTRGERSELAELATNLL
ncbi:TPA: phosphate starvation-inducible protein PhoH [Candidatus Sumerlaeota bacterium]|nr:phosphate starvation-inducible protein PhoH [Candidatus Sumerlaeota bacterium]